jgi:hypothetical protein
MRPTHRTYRNVVNGKDYQQYINDTTGCTLMIDEQTGERVTRFFLNAVACSPVTLKAKGAQHTIKVPGHHFVPLETSKSYLYMRQDVDKRFRTL